MEGGMGRERETEKEEGEGRGGKLATGGLNATEGCWLTPPGHAD